MDLTVPTFAGNRNPQDSVHGDLPESPSDRGPRFLFALQPDPAATQPGGAFTDRLQLTIN